MAFHISRLKIVASLFLGSILALAGCAAPVSPGRRSSLLPPAVTRRLSVATATSQAPPPPDLRFKRTWFVQWESLGQITGIVSTTNLAAPVWIVESRQVVTNSQDYTWTETDITRSQKFYRAFTDWDGQLAQRQAATGLFNPP